MNIPFAPKILLKLVIIVLVIFFNNGAMAKEMTTKDSIEFLERCDDVFVGELLTHKGKTFWRGEARANFKVTHWISGGYYGKNSRYKERKVYIPHNAVLKESGSYLVAVNENGDRAEALILAKAADPIVQKIETKIKAKETFDEKNSAAIPEIYSELIRKLPLKQKIVYLYRFDRNTTIEVHQGDLNFADHTIKMIEGSSFGEKSKPYIAITSAKQEAGKMLYYGHTSEGVEFQAEAEVSFSLWHITQIKLSDQRVFKTL